LNGIVNKSTKTEWFKEWFNEQYLHVYRHRDQAEATRFVNSWDWKKINQNGTCLDIGCGAGRYVDLLAQKGMVSFGLDLSKPLLRVAKKEVSSEVHLVCADMRAIPFKKTFDLIICLFTSFGYFKSDDEHLQVINSMAKLLNTNGCLILDVPNPFTVRRRVETEPITVRSVDDLEITEERTFFSSPLRVIKRITIKQDKEIRKYNESVRLFKLDELESMMNNCGIKQSEPIWGDYDGSHYSTASERIIYFGVNGD
jgi:SAM-dependent methyltransferase